jgi:hypothetical protein
MIAAGPRGRPAQDAKLILAITEGHPAATVLFIHLLGEPGLVLRPARRLRPHLARRPTAAAHPASTCSAARGRAFVSWMSNIGTPVRMIRCSFFSAVSAWSGLK